MEHLRKYCIAKVVVHSHLNPNAQYSNLDSEQYISSAMGPELMINFCPRDYPGIYAVKIPNPSILMATYLLKYSSHPRVFIVDVCYKLKDARCR